MSRIQGDYDDFRSIPYNKFGWKHFTDISRDRSNSNECNCDCSSSNPEFRIKKIGRNQRKESHASTERRDKSDKKIRVTRSRKKFRDGDTRKPGQSPENAIYLNLCDQPRRVDKSYKKTSTKQYSPDIMQVKSVEVIKSWSMDRCRARRPENSEKKKIKRSKKLKGQRLRKPKLINPKYSNTSISSAFSSLNDEKYIIPQVPSSRNEIFKNNYRIPRKVERQLSKEKNSRCYNCMIEGVKSSRVQTYPKSNRRREESRERIYKQESPRPAQEFAKKRETIHKVRGECQMDESWSRGLSCKTQKLCRMFKTPEARRFTGCHCIEIDRENLSVNCQCPECPCVFKTIRNDNSKRIQQINDENSKRIICNDSEICPSELNSEIICNCEHPQLDYQQYNTKINIDDRKVNKSNKLLHDVWQQCDEHCDNYEKKYQIKPTHLREMHRMKAAKKTNETINKCMTQNLIDKTTISEIPLSKKKDISYQNETNNPPVQFSQQCDQQSASSNDDFDEINDKQDPVEAVASLCEKLIMIKRDFEPQYYSNNPNFTCRTDQCKCESIISLPKEKIESNHHTKYSRNKKSKSRIKRHQFVFPKIFKREANGENTDAPKMFVYNKYSADSDDESPLSLYKTGSFVNCAIKRNDNNGNKYYVEYIQKYASPVWKNDDNFENEIKSTEYLSSDDYG